MSTPLRRLIVLCVVAAPLAAVAGACSATEDQPSSSSSSGSDSSGTGGTGGSLGFGGGGSPTTGEACSSDLQSIVDENGDVVAECPPDQGCFQGACMPACEAAASSQGTIGCDFWAPDPPFRENGSVSDLAGPCYAVFVANTWKRAANITISRGGESFDVTTFGRIPKGIGAATTYEPLPATGLPPNEVAVLFLSHRPGVENGTSLECPVEPAVLDDAAVQGPGKGDAFHVVSDTPVSSYAMLPYGGAISYLPSATLLFPSTAWGTNYYALTPRNTGAGSLWALVVATEDATTISVAPVMNLPGGGGVPPAPQGVTTQLTLQAGEFAQWIDSSGTADPTSTVFQSDKPIGLFTGNTSLAVQSMTSGQGGEDSAHQQLPHVRALGNEYIGAGVATRLASMAPESVPYRLLGVVAGTQLTWDPGPPDGAPTSLAAGEVAEFESSEAFSVRSQDADHPFAFTQYLPGGPAEGVSRPDCAPVKPFDFLTCGLGDEEWVSLTPPQQFSERYVFFTDPTYATTNLVVVRVKGADGFADVNVGCLGTLSGWQPVGADGKYEFAHVDLVRAAVPLGDCNISRHEASSTEQFGVVVWGTDYNASYGYPAGGGIGNINAVVVPVPK